MKLIWLSFIFLLSSDFVRSDEVNNAFSERVSNHINSYLLPENHPVKQQLDLLFSNSEVLINTETMRNAGFIDPKPRKWTHLIVTRHPDFPGYVFKVYTDQQEYHKGMPEHHWWIIRIMGAEKIRKYVEENDLEHFFKVPHKWIYSLPPATSQNAMFLKKHFILIEEDMEIYEDAVNENLWRSEAITKDFLFSLYCVLESQGLRDCAKPENIPFSRDGRVAFVDTQTWKEWPVSYKKLTPYLSPSMQRHWKDIIKQK